ncbi:MAG: hypothetical protein FWE45_04240 [Firmicutes bacterium]|nr:hypothetical protein [Bacillota bacterium]
MHKSTKFSKFFKGLSLKKSKGLFILFACIIGALTLIIVPTIGSNANNVPVGGGGVASNPGPDFGDSSNNHREPETRPDGTLPTGLGSTTVFQVLSLPEIVRAGATITNVINIDTEDAIVNWTINDQDAARITFFPFTIHTQSEAVLEITITVRRTSGSLFTRTIAFSIYEPIAWDCDNDGGIIIA